MGSPSGQYSRLYFRKEAVPGTFAVFSAVAGLKLYQEEFQPRPTKTPIRYQENKGGVIFDNPDFTPGPQGVTGTLRFALRYSGVHAVMLGHALGQMGTTGPSGSPPQYTHAADGGPGTPSLPGRYNSLSFLHQRPINDAGTTFKQTELIGAKIGRMRLTQSVGQPFIICEMDIVAQEARYNTTATSPAALPPDTGTGFAPHESLVQASHVVGASGNNFSFQSRLGTTPGTEVFPRLEEWTLELNNFPEQLGVISNINRQSNPARGQVREVTGSWVVEQDASTDQIEAAFGLAASDPSAEIAMAWSFENPAQIQEDMVIQVSSAYITQPERGTTGTGPQRRRYNFTAHGAGPNGNWPAAYPLKVTIKSLIELPPSSADGPKYGDHVTGAGG